MENEKTYLIKLTSKDAFWIIETMWTAIFTGKMFPANEEEISSAYNKILDIWRRNARFTICYMTTEHTGSMRR